ncbi:hypothetical protein D1AOALGA4SA_1733 [Olavius algarvensis Delta 1 endosymbiont]|nr:hypothetical protein D1AOALGA4SA_1733 [Olavius algarvensis Delta 1 endosymbiont]
MNLKLLKALSLIRWGFFIGKKGFRCQVSGFSLAEYFQSDRRKNSEKANNEYRTRNNEYRSKAIYHYYF